VLLTVVAPFSVALWVLTAWLWPNAFICDLMPGYWWLLGGMVLLGVPLAIGSLLAPHQQAVSDKSRNLLRQMLAWLHNPKMGWVLASLVTGAVSGLLMKAAVHKAFVPMSAWYGADWHELSLGVPLTSLVFLAAVTIQIVLTGRTFYGSYREWWARVGRWILILTIVWAVGSSLAIYAPLLLFAPWLLPSSKVGSLVVWLFNSLFKPYIMKSKNGKSSEPAGVNLRLLRWISLGISILGLALYLPIVLELSLASLYGANMKMNEVWIQPFAESPNWVFAHFAILNSVNSVWLIPIFIVILLVCLQLSYRVNLNEFSMNLMYRNRLVRCYLGATHQERDPNSISGPDSGDDLLLSTLRSSQGYSGPLPILNGSLNLVSTRDLAYQVRKAESFPMTPLRCGFDTLTEQSNLERNYALEKIMGHAASISKYAYRPTAKYGNENGGFYLGTAMIISGAAAGPNAGYDSVSSPALLMTFFNLRLGFCAGNPRNNITWTHPGPKVGLAQLLRELFGLTNDNAKYVYLSDGSHFENLGVYELVKRRCKFILACDAGADPEYAFDDLGNAIRKCREDIGVEIELDTTPLIPKSSGTNSDKSGKKQTTQHCVVGTIHYDMVDPEGGKGIFVYLKASLTGDEPADVLNYQTGHTTFPHQSTADQSFTESQFESYRRLGQHVVETLFAGREATAHEGPLISARASDKLRGLSTAELFEDLKEKWPKNVPKEA